MDFFIEWNNTEEIEIDDKVFLYNLCNRMTENIIFFISCLIDDKTGFEPL